MTLLTAGRATAAADHTHFGPALGLNIANWHGSDAERIANGRGSAPGFALGGFAAFPLTDRLRLVLEGLFSMKGATYHYDLGVAGSLDTLYRYDYFEIPVLVRFATTDGKVRPALLAGLAPAFLVGATSYVTTGNTTRSAAIDKANGADLGLVVGGGIDIEAGQNLVQVELRYTHGLRSIGQPDKDGNVTDIANSVVTILVGYAF